MDITTLTPVERLQLINQFSILEKLYPEHAEGYAESRRIIAHKRGSRPAIIGAEHLCSSRGGVIHCLVNAYRTQ